MTDDFLFIYISLIPFFRPVSGTAEMFLLSSSTPLSLNLVSVVPLEFVIPRSPVFTCNNNSTYVTRAVGAK